MTISADIAVDAVDAPAEEDPGTPVEVERRRSIRPRLARMLTYGILPVIVVILSMAAGFARWSDSRLREEKTARIESVQAAGQIAVAMLSYQPNTVEKDLAAAQDRLTGSFLDSYRSLVRDVVVPGSHGEEDRRSRQGGGFFLGLGEPKSRSRTAIHQSGRYGRQRCTDQHRVQCAGHPRQGGWALAGFRFRPGLRNVPTAAAVPAPPNCFTAQRSSDCPAFRRQTTLNSRSTFSQWRGPLSHPVGCTGRKVCDVRLAQRM